MTKYKISQSPVSPIQFSARHDHNRYIIYFQLKLNSLYSILHISETKSTRNGLPGVRQFGRSKFQNATGKNVVIMFSDIMTLYVHSGHDKSHLAPDSERYVRSSAPTGSVAHSLK
jgi:hypothetical protein